MAAGAGDVLALSVHGPRGVVDLVVPAAATVADVALYAYVALAPEGGVPLDPYPAVCAWLARIGYLPRFVPMRRTPAAVAA